MRLHRLTLIVFAFLLSALPVSAQVEERVPGSQAEIQLSFAPIVKQTAPAVVNVYAIRENQASQSPLFNDPFFERFFGENSPFSRRQPRTTQSLGSGVIVDPSGLILTNNHVVEDATNIRISLADGREFETDLKLADPDTDLAVLQIRDSGDRKFPALEFADSDMLEVGDLVLAIGNPFGVGQTVTSGIVSALARTGVGVSDYQFFIQTDAAINPGNSGGALVDMSGKLVGINTAIFSRSGGSNGIGFAIPANMARFIANASYSGGEIERPFVGVTLQGITSDIADSLGLDTPRGALVVELEPDGPAERAGLQPGDVIVAFDDVPLQDEGAFGYRLATKLVGENARLEIMRDGAYFTVSVPLVAQPEEPEPTEVAISGSSRFAGAAATVLTADIMADLGMNGEPQGVVITRVERNSSAQALGLRPGDVILELNGAQIGDVETFVEAANAATRGLRLTVRRGNSIIRRFIGG